jgi:serine phosphatase RsbU (regulator of sigma subunit)
MKSNLFKNYIHLLLILFSVTGIFLINTFEFYSNVYIPLLYYVKEILTIVALLLSYLFWERTENYRTASITYILKSFLFSILIFSALLLLKMIFFKNSVYATFFPYPPENFMAILYSTIQGALLIFLLPIILIYLRYLYTYKRKFSTPVFFNLFITLSAVSSILFAIQSGTPPNIFSNDFTLKDIIFKGTIIYTLFLSLRHKWITHLSKRQKFAFSFISLIVIPILILLFDSLRGPTSAFSLTLLYFFNHLWFFVIFYGISSMLTLWLQLPTAAEFEQKLKSLSAIHAASRELNTYSKDEKFIENILRTAINLSKADDSWLELFSDEQHVPTRIYPLNLDQKLLTDFEMYSRHQKIFRRIMKDRKSIIIEDVKNHPLFHPYYEWSNQLRSIMACPLFSRTGQIIGIMYVAHHEAYFFDVSDLELFESFSTQVALSIENVNLLEELVKNEKYQQELKIAREVQLSLLPSRIPEFKPFQVAFESLTASEVGGDFYDIVTYKDGNKGIVLGDVSGKGTQAAFYMAEFKGIIQAVSQLCSSPRELAILTNRILYENVERKVFVTAVFLKFHNASNMIKIARAGHTLPILIDQRDKGIREIQSQGIGLGLDRGILFDKTIEEIGIELQRGNALLLYTDGLSELRKSSHDLYDFEDFLKRLSFQVSTEMDADNLKEWIITDLYNFLKDHPINDDISFIVITN